MCDESWYPIKCEEFTVTHSAEAMETVVFLYSPGRKPKKGMVARYHIYAGGSMIEIEGVATRAKGNVLITGTAGECDLVVVDQGKVEA